MIARPPRAGDAVFVDGASWHLATPTTAPEPGYWITRHRTGTRRARFVSVRAWRVSWIRGAQRWELDLREPYTRPLGGQRTA